jgi:hypothetical protein
VHKRPVTWTGRGLRLAYVGNIVLAATAAIYFLNYSGRLAGFGFFIAGFVGLFSIQRMWLGRNEFGPDHARNARRGLLLFFAAAALFVYALVAGLTNVVETLNFRNMRPPVLALALALAFETMSGTFLLLELVGSKRRHLAAVHGVVGALLAVLLLAVGMQLVGEFEAARLTSPEIAQSRLSMFLGEFLPYVMASFLVTRLWSIFLLRKARDEVRTAEHEALEAEQAPSPPPVT